MYRSYPQQPQGLSSIAAAFGIKSSSQLRGFINEYISINCPAA
jgi:hypothetical protein